MRRIIVLCLVLAVTNIYAQDEVITILKNESDKKIKKDESDTLPDAWKKGGVYSVNF